ncbi:hypothetical protein PVK06_013093 [Gossypium arboreum]|uniref:Uncharacterized protein n=1 Tax=Gossypium arboreum TaxID=29729 RepID=A0ABR0QDH9_GOSAR|nr:hypothetical protein PVK06_013093 [Gossypium arboreum]
MREIQNGVLSTKEKQKRDRKEKITKGKEITRCEESTVNLSLFDSDISNRRRETKLEVIIKDDVRKLWGDDNCEFRFVAAVEYLMGGDNGVKKSVRKPLDRGRSERSNCLGSEMGS